MSFSAISPITFHDKPEDEDEQEHQHQHQQEQPDKRASATASNTNPSTSTSTSDPSPLLPQSRSSSSSTISRPRNTSRHASSQESLPIVSEDGSQQQPALDEKWSLSPALARLVNMYTAHVGLFDIIPPMQNVKQHSYRVSVLGVAGCGKSTTVAHMCGDSVPYKHVETAGIHVSTVHWPIRMTHAGDATIHLCSLSLWDAGHASTQSYGYLNQQLLPSSPSAVPFDGCMYVCSAMEWGSYKWVQNKLDDDVARTFAKIVVMTKCDQFLRREVAEQDLLSLVDVHPAIEICKIANLPLSKDKFYQKPEVVSLLNLVSLSLVRREQAMAAAAASAPPAYVSRSLTPNMLGISPPSSSPSPPSLQPISPTARVTQSMAIGTSMPSLRRAATTVSPTAKTTATATATAATKHTLKW